MNRFEISVLERKRPLAAPNRRSLVREGRAAFDLARMIRPLVGAQLRRRPLRNAPHVIVVPGFGSGDAYMRPLRAYLNRMGFSAEGWGLGKNLAGIDLQHTRDDLSDRWVLPATKEYRGETSVPYLCDRFVDRVRLRHKEVGRPISLVGWSLGGFIAREAARDLPDLVDRVVTMGSPTIGGPKYTAAAAFFRKRGMDLDWIEKEIEKRERWPIQQPITAIISRSDAVVSWESTIDHYSKHVRHIEVDGAHLGMGFNPTIWAHIVEALGDEPD